MPPAGSAPPWPPPRSASTSCWPASAGASRPGSRWRWAWASSAISRCARNRRCGPPPGPPLVVVAWLVATRAPHAGWLLGLVAAAALGFGAAVLHAAAAPPAADPATARRGAERHRQDVDLLPEGQRVRLGEVRFGPDDPVQPRSIRVRPARQRPRAPRARRPAGGARPGPRALRPRLSRGWDFQRAPSSPGTAVPGFAIGPAEVTPGAGDAPPLSGLRAGMEARVAGRHPRRGRGGGGRAADRRAAIRHPRADLAAMRDSGLAHLLSVSGLHIADRDGRDLLGGALPGGLLALAGAAGGRQGLGRRGRAWPRAASTCC